MRDFFQWMNEHPSSGKQSASVGEGENMTNTHNNGLEPAATSNGRGDPETSQPPKIGSYFRRWANSVYNFLRHVRRNEHRQVDIDGDDLNRLLTELMEDRHHIDQANVNIKAEYPETDINVNTPPSASDGNNKNYKKAPFHFVNTEWGLGWTDGRSGQPLKLNRPTLEAAAQLELKERVQAIKQRIAVKLTRSTALQELLAKRQDRLRTKEATYEKLLEKRNANYLEFSRPLGYLYLVFAILLFLADVPLSLKLVASGFQVPVEADLPEGIAAIGSTPKLLIDHLLFYPRYVVGMFWEALALAGGIAFVGIIVKYYVDLIILRDNDSERPRWIAIGFLTVILLGFGATVFMLGHFRAEQQMQAVRQEIHEKLRTENDNNKAFNANNPLEPQRPVRSDVEIADEVSKRFIAQASVQSAWLTYTFIALTVLLPVVGGVCFSASGAKFRNAKRYWLAFLDYKKAENERDRLVLQLAKERGDVTELSARLYELQSDPSYLTAMVDFKMGVYQHGYARGRTIPETLQSGASLYERCETTIAKLLSRKAQEKVWGTPQ